MTRRWMRMVGAALAGVLVAGAAVASDTDPYGLEYGYEHESGSGNVWADVGWGTLTVLGNLVYVPAKLAYAGAGALTGGMALGLTGGDVHTAQEIWEPSLYGDYFLTPKMIRGEEGISFAGAPADTGAPMPGYEPADAEGSRDGEG